MDMTSVAIEDQRSHMGHEGESVARDGKEELFIREPRAADVRYKSPGSLLRRA